MLALQLIRTDFPLINLSDKVSLALQIMEDYEVQHLPVVSDGNFLGLVSKEDLLDTEDGSPVAAIQNLFIRAYIKAEQHFSAAVKLAATLNLSLIPVINDNQELTGLISSYELLTTLSNFIGNEERGGIIVLEIEKKDYSFGEISRLVETNDAYITQLNTLTNQETGILTVTVKINKNEISDVIATFQRYDYHVRHYFGEEAYTNELKDNYHQLIAYLNI